MQDVFVQIRITAERREEISRGIEAIKSLGSDRPSYLPLIRPGISALCMALRGGIEEALSRRIAGEGGGALEELRRGEYGPDDAFADVVMCFRKAAAAELRKVGRKHGMTKKEVERLGSHLSSMLDMEARVACENVLRRKEDLARHASKEQNSH